jgi:peptide subunit release factor 1 (eRF1)
LRESSQWDRRERRGEEVKKKRKRGGRRWSHLGEERKEQTLKEVAMIGVNLNVNPLFLLIK